MSMKTYNFKVVIEPDEDFYGRPCGWHVYVPALKQLAASTWGETQEEALKNINEVVHMIIEELIEDGQPLPESPISSSAFFDVPCSSQSRIAPDHPRAS